MCKSSERQQSQKYGETGIYFSANMYIYKVLLNLGFKRSSADPPPPPHTPHSAPVTLTNFLSWLGHFKSHEKMLKSYTVDFTAVKCNNNIYMSIATLWQWKLTCISFKYKYMPDFLILVIDIF